MLKPDTAHDEGCMLSESARAQLRYVQLPAYPLDLTRFPDFLIVGPQRTGTTWLHAHLRFHPEIMLSEPKELYFFSSLKTPDSPRFRSNALEWYLQFFHEPLWRVLLHNVISVWRYRERYRPKVRGEATASYAALDRDVIEEITTLRPDVKVILMIRNPIDRAWSHAKKDLARNRGRKLEEVPEGEIEAFLASPYQRQCARYAENIDNWSACLRPGHLLVGLFDDIDARPEALLLEVMSFLGVTADRRYISRAVRTPVNPTGASRMPDRYRRLLEDLLREDVANLRQSFGLSWAPPEAGGRLEQRPAASDRQRNFIFALDRR